jgi:hypothetical protein
MMEICGNAGIGLLLTSMSVSIYLGVAIRGIKGS